MAGQRRGLKGRLPFPWTVVNEETEITDSAVQVPSTDEKGPIPEKKPTPTMTELEG